MEKTSLEIKGDHRPSDCSKNLKYGLEIFSKPPDASSSIAGGGFYITTILSKAFFKNTIVLTS